MQVLSKHAPSFLKYLASNLFQAFGKHPEEQARNDHEWNGNKVASHRKVKSIIIRVILWCVVENVSSNQKLNETFEDDDQHLRENQFRIK